jgi:hypothetical protein
MSSGLADGMFCDCCQPTSDSMAGWATSGSLHGLGQPAALLLLVRHPLILLHLGGFAFFELGPRPSVDRHLLIEGVCGRRIFRQIESSFE